MTVLGIGANLRPINDFAVERVNPVKPGDFGLPLLIAEAGMSGPKKRRIDSRDDLHEEAERDLQDARRQVEAARNSNTLAALAQAHAAMGDAETAVTVAQEALESSLVAGSEGAATWIDPSSARIGAEVLVRFGHADLAYQLLNRAPITTSLSMIFASTAAALGEYKEAHEVLSHYDNWVAAAFRGYLYAKEQNFSKAVGCLRKAVREEPDDADSLLNLAVSLWNLGSTKKAIQMALRATRSAPGRKDLSLLYLELLLAIEDSHSLSLEIAQLDARRVVPDARYLEIQGRALLLAGDDKKAISKLSRAGREANKEGDKETEGRVLSNLVRLRMANGSLTQAQASEKLQSLLSQFPDNDVVAVVFAEVACRRSEAGPLRAAFSRVGDNTIGIRRAYLEHQIAVLEGDNARAASAAERWFDMEQDNPMSASALLVALGIGVGDLARSVPIAEYALHRFPDSRAVVNHAAYVLAMAGRAKEAIAVLERSAGDDFVLKATLGLAFLADGEFDRGMRLYREAADQAENVDSAWRSLMTIYQGLIIRQLGLYDSLPAKMVEAVALVPVPLPEDWSDRPDFLRVHSVCEKNGYPWPPNL